MNRLVACLLALLLSATPSLAWDWTKAAKMLMQSSFALQDPRGGIHCTGWMIDKDREYALTAAHCLPSAEGSDDDLMRVDGQPVQVMKFDENLDVAVLRIAKNNRPDLKPQYDPIRVGQPAGYFGFARESGLYSHFRAGVVSAVDADVDDLGGGWVVFDQPGIGGQSGGAIVNYKGEVISMVQRSDRRLSQIGKGIYDIYQFTKEFWRQ